MEQFRKDFKQLLIRYASFDILSTSSIGTPESFTLLTNQQILDGIHQELLETLHVNLHNVDAAALKTPANEIIITTPATPDIPRYDYNKNNTLSTRSKSPEFKSGETIMEVSDNDNTLTKSTNINDNKQTKDESKLDKPIFDKGVIKKELQLIEEAYNDTMNAANKLKELKEILEPEIRPVRRLSMIMGRVTKPTQQNSNSNLRSIRAKNLRRSIVASEEIPLTPTSSMPSRLSLPTMPPAKKINNNVMKKCSSTESTRSISNLKSPIKSKTAKYSHVQSTIPKPGSIALKRKAQ